jgi:hypothetical protein
MRFQPAFDSLETENRFLRKMLTFGFSFGILLCFGLLASMMKAPLVIERACNSKLLKTVDSLPTEAEIRAFITESIPQRLNSDSNVTVLLSARQIVFRESEQLELKKQQMTQTIVIRNISSDKDSMSIEADRLISIQNIRSAFRFPLKVKVQQVPRTSVNPYGLELLEADPIKEVSK